MRIKFIVYSKRYIHIPKTESKKCSSVGRMSVEYSRGPGVPFPVAHKPRKWCFSVILVLGRWRQEDQEFKGHSQQHNELRVAWPTGPPISKSKQQQKQETAAAITNYRTLMFKQNRAALAKLYRSPKGSPKT